MKGQGWRTSTNHNEGNSGFQNAFSKFISYFKEANKSFKKLFKGLENHQRIPGKYWLKLWNLKKISILWILSSFVLQNTRLSRGRMIWHLPPPSPRIRAIYCMLYFIIFMRRYSVKCVFAKGLSPQKTLIPKSQIHKFKSTITKTLGPQIAKSQSATFAEDPQI